MNEESVSLVLGIGALLVGAFYIVFHGRRVNRAWKEAASQLGLRYHGGFRRSISGKYRGYPVLVKTKVRYRLLQRHSDDYTFYRIEYPSLGLGLRITREGVVDALVKKLGVRDIEIGQKRFDDRYLIEGRNPEAVRQFLTPSLATRIERLFLSCTGKVSVDDTRIEFMRFGIDLNPGVMTHVLTTLVNVVEHMALRRFANADPEDATPKQPEGESSKSMSPPWEATANAAFESAFPDLGASVAMTVGRPGEVPIEELVIEGEALYLAGNYAEAAKVFERASFIAPLDEEIAGWWKQANERQAGEKTSPFHDEAAGRDSVPEE